MVGSVGATVLADGVYWIVARAVGLARADRRRYRGGLVQVPSAREPSRASDLPAVRAVPTYRRPTPKLKPASHKKSRHSRNLFYLWITS
jgi:hypothetical protein